MGQDTDVSDAPLAKPVSTQSTPKQKDIQRKKIILFSVLGALVALLIIFMAWRAGAATTVYTLWSTSDKPAVEAFNDSKSVNLGLRFKSSVVGQVTGLRFYKSAQNTGTHTGSLWDAAGKELRRVTFTNETASGWQTAKFSSPVTITANAIYTISYHAPNGKWSTTDQYFASSARTSGVLTAPATTTAVGNGVFTYASTPAHPTNAYLARNYWVDPILEVTNGTNTTAPAAPTNFKAVVSGSSIKLSWTKPSTSTAIAKYYLYRNDKGSAVLGYPGAADTTYTDTDSLVSGKSYTYTIKTAITSNGSTVLSTNGATATVTYGSGGTTTPTPTGSSYDTTVKNDGPVGYWPMSGAGSTSETDVISGNNGTYQNGATTAATMPNSDKASVFNGNNKQYLSIPSKSAYSVPTTKQLTWEAWIRPDNLTVSGDYTNFIGKCANYSNTCEWEGRFYQQSPPSDSSRCNRISAYVFNTSAGLGSAADWSPTCGKGIIKAGQWYHVVAQYRTDTTPSYCQNGSTYPGGINIWVNGVIWNSAKHGQTGCMSQYKVKPTASTSIVTVGTMAISENWFRGAVGKVAIYNKLLTDAQIANHYKVMTGKDRTGTCGDTCNF